jgi:ribosomal protein L24E
MRKRYLLAPMASIAVLAAGCGGGSNESQAPPAKPQVKSTPAPSQKMPSVDTGAELTVRSPSPDTVVTANRVPFRVGLSNFKVDCRFAGTPNRQGVGHYHVMLDGALINMFCSDSDKVSLQNVKPGRHELAFVPAVDDHTDDLGAEKKVGFTYQPKAAPKAIAGEESPGKPSIRILSPKAGATVHGSFDLRVAPRNFEFSCDLYGKPNVAGYGHWHANVDSTTKGMMGMATMLGMSCARSFHVSLAGLSPGKHTFYAILEDNQHAPTPKAQDSVTLNVR